MRLDSLFSAFVTDFEEIEFRKFNSYDLWSPTYRIVGWAIFECVLFKTVYNFWFLSLPFVIKRFQDAKRKDFALRGGLRLRR